MINRRSLCRHIVPLLIALMGAMTHVTLAADKPNILFIFADDHAYNAVGAYGNEQVKTPHINVWIDGKSAFECDIMGRKVGIRPEVELSKPLGVATWNTTACLRNIYVRKLPKASEKKKPAEEDKAK